jgi:hypothetical protein
MSFPWLLGVLPLADAGSKDPFVVFETLSSTYGLSVADVDGDGWTDIVTPQSHLIWLNDEAKDWTSVDLPELAVWFTQYGVSLGDYDADGLNDISTDRAALRHPPATRRRGLGIDDDDAPLRRASRARDERLDRCGRRPRSTCIPAYYGDSGFYWNLGPDKTGEYVFDEVATDIGIELSKTSGLRPEGAQFADVDRDGDADLYVCAELLRNKSNPGDLLFETDNGGIEKGFDEGAAFADIDMDGDFDLGVMYQGIPWDPKLPRQAFILWENLGDGTFVQLPAETTEDYDIRETYNLGMSFADWDMDGDPDVTFSDRFEVNQWRESADRQFLKIMTDAGQTCATPGWFDWDFDGDLDIGKGLGWDRAVLHQPSVRRGPEAERGFLRVRPVTDSKKISEGTDTEFGATVDVHIQGEAPEVRRRSFVASGHGYLNQSEYPLTFGFADMKTPVVDVAVDFTNPSDEGLWRVDRFVNPALGSIDVTSLALPREVRVFRSGDVEIGGKRYSAATDEGPLLETPGGLAAPSIDDELAVVEPGTWVGAEITIPKDADPTRGAAIREIVVRNPSTRPFLHEVTGNVCSGRLAVALIAGASGPVLPDNRRVDVGTDFSCTTDTYRVMALVTQSRTFAGQALPGWRDGRTRARARPRATQREMGAAVGKTTDRSPAVRWRERVVATGGRRTPATQRTQRHR